MRFVNNLSVLIVCELSSLCDIRMVYSWVVVMPLEIVFRGDVIRNTSTLAMSSHYEIVFPVLLDNSVSLFLSRFRSRRVGGTTCYLPVYEPVVHEVLRLADGVISRTPIRDDGLARLRVMKHEIISGGEFVVHFKIFQITDVIRLAFLQVVVDTLAVEVVVGSVRQSSVFVLVDRLDIFVLLIDIVFEAFADVGAQVNAEGICWSIQIDVVSEVMLLEHRIQGVARGSIDDIILKHILNLLCVTVILCTCISLTPAGGRR